MSLRKNYVNFDGGTHAVRQKLIIGRTTCSWIDKLPFIISLSGSGWDELGLYRAKATVSSRVSSGPPIFQGRPIPRNFLAKGVQPIHSNMNPGLYYTGSHVIPSHSKPVPEKPVLQTHSKLPAVLEQIPFW